MSRLTLSDIMTQIASTVNQEATPPTAGDSEFELWLAYINRSLFEWAQANDWEVLRKIYYPGVTGTLQATVSMPLDFHKLAAPIVLYNGEIETGTQYTDIPWEEARVYPSSDKHTSIIGDLTNGFSIIFNPGTLASGASIQIQYFAMPTSLASPAQVPVIPDSQFLVDRTIAYIFESRSDARFQLQEQKARERLLNMVDNENDRKYNSYAGANRIMDDTRRQGFRLGRD